MRTSASVITSLNLPRTLGLLPPDLPYTFILLRKSKMSVFCESRTDERSPRMTEGGGGVKRTFFVASVAEPPTPTSCVPSEAAFWG